MDTKQTIVSPVGRIAFLKNLFTPNKKERYQIAVVFDKEDAPLLKELKALEKAAIEEKWGNKVPSGLKSPFKVEKREDMLARSPFLADRITLNASNGFPIQVINKKGIALKDGEIKAGDYVKLAISAFAYSNETAGVGFNVSGVLLEKEGEAFYGRPEVSSIFGISVEDSFGLTESEEESQETDFDSFGF